MDGSTLKTDTIRIFITTNETRNDQEPKTIVLQTNPLYENV